MTPPNPYVPERGDLIYLSFDPTKGHEQRGRRPAFVLSPRSYNRKSALALVVPVTSKVKGYPFEVTLPDNLQIQGAILVDQIKCLDWQARNAQFVEAAPPSVIAEVQAKIEPLIL